LVHFSAVDPKLAIFCNHSAIHFEQIDQINGAQATDCRSKQNKHGGRAKQSKNCLRVENIAFIFFL
jgi:hypothetical protein